MKAAATALAMLLLAELVAAPAAWAAEAAPAPAATPGNVVPAVTVARAERREIVETIVVGGTLVPREEVMVAPEVDGLVIREILAEAGQTVAKGEVLARLSTDLIDASLAQNAADIARADAAIAQAKAQIAEAEAVSAENRKALARAEKLNKQGFASEERLDQSISSAGVSTARVAAAREAAGAAQAQKEAALALRRELEWRLSRTEVRAPVAGIVSARNARIGQIAAIAGNPLFRLIENGDIELEAEVADMAMPRLAAGQAVEVAPAGLGEEIAGSVRLVSPEIDRTTRLGHVRIALPHDPRLKIGAYARGTLEVARRNGVTVPLSAVSYGESAAFIQVVSGGSVRTRPIRLGFIDGRSAEILSGLAEGEEVVARAGSFLRDGDRILAQPLEAVEASQ